MLIIATMMLITRSVMRIRGREGHCEVIRSLGAIVQGKGRKYVRINIVVPRFAHLWCYSRDPFTVH